VNRCFICKSKILVSEIVSFCPDCKAGFLALRNFGIVSIDALKKKKRVYGLYGYTGVVRQAILSAKIRADLVYLENLGYLFVSNPLAVKLACWADVIIPVPSSLGSRVSGRGDLAWFLASILSKYSHKELVSFPWPCTLRFIRRSFWSSQVKRSLNHNYTSYLNEYYRAKLLNYLDRRYGNCRILIVDDVVTTGFTLGQVTGILEDFNCRCVSLAVAKSTP